MTIACDPRIAICAARNSLRCALFNALHGSIGMSDAGAPPVFGSHLRRSLT